MKTWPWVTTAAAVLLVASPLGREVIHDAFFSGEQLSRSLGQLLVAIGVGLLVVLGVCEYLIGVVIRRRRARNTES